MDSKKAIIVVVVILLLLGGGYFLYNSQKANQATSPTAASTQQKSGGVFSSIKDALSKSLTLKCDYPDSKGNTVSVYIKGGQVRMMGFASGSSAQSYGQALMRDSKMYIWDDKKKEGMVMAFNPQEVKKTADSMKQAQGADQGSAYLAGLEKYKDYCKTSTVSDSVFTVPGDIKFVDLAQQMKNSGVDTQKMMQQYQKESPTATP